MSKPQTRKDIEAARREMAQRVEQLNEAATEAKAKVDELQGQVDSLTAELEQARGDIEAREAARAQAETDHAAALADRDESIAALDQRVTLAAGEVEAVKADMQKQVDGEKARADKAEAALRNPAFADASLTTATDLPQPDADAEADAAEQAVQEAEQEQEVAPHYAKYRKLMEQGQSRLARRYWRENEAAIAAEQKALAEQDANDEQVEG